jgi:parallel beta-helix repeat protein
LSRNLYKNPLIAETPPYLTRNENLLSIKRKALVLTFISVFILLSVETFFTSSVNADPLPLPELPTPIYIRENGTIEGGAGAIQQNGNVYTFVRDINETIEIQKDNIVIDGNGFSLTKPPEVKTDDLLTPSGWFPSIQTSNKSNIIIKNIIFDKCYTGISVEHSSNIIIIQNSFENGNEGIYMSSCTNCSIIGNKLIDNSAQGLDIDGSYFNVAYNTISRNQRHGGWLTVSYSNISRNDITDNIFDNRGIGLYLYGNNSYNRIFENNFINNEVGLQYAGAKGGSVNNTVYNNYWSNYQAAIQQSNAADATSQLDQSPLASPISTSFDPSLFPLPSLTPTASPPPNAQSDSEPFPTILVATASAASVAIIGVGLLVYFKKRKH